jgi:flagellar hook-associated protein 1 FlgK
VGSQVVNISRELTGGKLGALQETRNEVLDPITNSLGRVALSLTDTYNAQHRNGMDLGSALGGDFFAIGNAVALPNNGNTGAATMDVTINDTSLLTDSNYLLTYDGGTNTYTLKRQSDDAIVANFAPGAMPFDSGEGFVVNNTGGAPANGDSFLIRPTEHGARTLDVVISDPAKVAAAAPVRTTTDLGNAGTGDIQLKSVTDTDPATSDFTAANTLATPLHIEFTGPNTYEVWDQAAPPPAASLSGPVAYNPATGSDVMADAGLAGYGYEVHISGEAKAGDIYRVDYNSQGISDNFNALQLSNLQTTKTMLNGTATYNDAYGQMVSDVGTKAHQADIENRAQQALLRTAQNEREEVSGVNLDEEAAKMMHYQQSYQAAAQVLSRSEQMFNMLIQAVRG